MKKKRNNFGKLVTQQTFRFLPRKKKTSPFFLKDLCQIYFVQKTKRTFSENFLLSFGLQKGKEKQSLYLQSFDFNDKTLLILFKEKFAYAKKKKREHLPLEKKTVLFVLPFQALVFSSNFPK